MAALVLLLPLLAPIILAVVLAAVLLPAVDALNRRGVPRAASAVSLTLLVPVALAAVVALMTRGLGGQPARWRDVIEQAAARLESHLGTDPLAGSLGAVDRREILLGLASGLLHGTAAVLGLTLSLLIAMYVLFFLLKDAHRFIDLAAARLPQRPAVTRAAFGSARLAISHYLVGTTAIAALDAAAIALGAYLLGLPLVGALALVTFVAAYVPYLGAWVSGAVAVLVALGAGGVDAGLWMLAIVLVTQNIVEGLARPFAFGVALDMHPLTVMAVSAIGAALCGVLGMFIAPPVAAIGATWYRLLRPPPGPAAGGTAPGAAEDDAGTAAGGPAPGGRCDPAAGVSRTAG